MCIADIAWKWVYSIVGCVFVACLITESLPSDGSAYHNTYTDTQNSVKQNHPLVLAGIFSFKPGCLFVELSCVGALNVQDLEITRFLDFVHHLALLLENTMFLKLDVFSVLW